MRTEAIWWRIQIKENSCEQSNEESSITYEKHVDQLAEYQLFQKALESPNRL